MKRNTAPPPPPPPPTVVIAKEAPQQDALKSVDESQASMDESLVYVPSPKVRCRPAASGVVARAWPASTAPSAA